MQVFIDSGCERKASAKLSENVRSTVDHKKKNDSANDSLRETDDDPQEIPGLDGIGTTPDDSEEDADATGGFEQQERQRLVGKPVVAAPIPHKNTTPAASESGGGGLATMPVSALVANYAAYAAAHGARVERHSGDEGMLVKLSGFRGEIEKRGIIDILLPLLSHSPLNPFAHVTAAIHLLSIFEQADRAVQVLTIAARGGRGFLPFLAGFALDDYFRSQLAPLPDKILREASRLYTELPDSVAQFNGSAAMLRKLPPAEKVMSWDGDEHTGTFIQLPSKGLSERYYAQHVGANEYQIYRSGSLSTPPQDGELYHVSRDGAIGQTPEQTPEQTRSITRSGNRR